MYGLRTDTLEETQNGRLSNYTKMADPSLAQQICKGNLNCWINSGPFFTLIGACTHTHTHTHTHTKGVHAMARMCTHISHDYDSSHRNGGLKWRDLKETVLCLATYTEISGYIYSFNTPPCVNFYFNFISNLHITLITLYHTQYK